MAAATCRHCSADGYSIPEVGENLLESLPRERSECFKHDPHRTAAFPTALGVDIA
jgi:hypothetical protein